MGLAHYSQPMTQGYHTRGYCQELDLAGSSYETAADIPPLVTSADGNMGLRNVIVESDYTETIKLIYHDDRLGGSLAIVCSIWEFFKKDWRCCLDGDWGRPLVLIASKRQEVESSRSRTVRLGLDHSKLDIL
ncbi:hypothetical protein V6N12_006521 [Hibiscus sabdariffa]|uniref:Uncharacterized protein n=1 Tax=Hibiscus sabdariffa TaxID=183260 RepID=A0ABR2EZ19_9ROSI